MLKQRMDAAAAIKEAIDPAEQSIELVGIELANLVKVMMEARRSSRVGLRIGSDAIAYAQTATALITEAQEAIMQAHDALNKAAEDAGLAHMYGKTVPPMGRQATPKLRAVPIVATN